MASSRVYPGKFYLETSGRVAICSTSEGKKQDGEATCSADESSNYDTVGGVSNDTSVA